MLIGQFANLKIKKRVSALKDLVFLVENINSQIMFSKKNISEIISDLVCDHSIKLKIISELEKNCDNNFSENWHKSVTTFAKQDCLKSEDEKILLSFGKSLGVTDLQGQSNNCNLHIDMLKKQLNKAEEKMTEKTRINTAISSFMAVAAVIIFY